MTIADGRMSGEHMLTIDEVRSCPKEMLTPHDIAPILGVHPYSINVKAKAGVLEFKAYFSGNRCKIPKIPFIKYMEESGNDVRRPESCDP